MNDSLDWFRDIHTSKSSVSFEEAMRNLETRGARLTPGTMLTYRYLPKHKDKLPVWDMYPLIIFLERTRNGWYGLNLHYLPPAVRKDLIEGLNTRKFTLPRIAQALAKNPVTAPCLKRYITKNLASKAALIPRTEWSKAIDLPYQKFVRK